MTALGLREPRDEVDLGVAYYITRIRSMKRDLFTHERIDDLLDTGDISYLIDVLLNSPYKKAMAEALTQFSGAEAVEEAVARDLVATFRQLQDTALPQFEPWVRGFLQRWDLAAAKSLLRCKYHGLTAEESETAWTPGPTLTVPVMRNLVAQDTMEDLIRRLIAWDMDLCASLGPRLPQFQADRDLAPLEEALVTAYFSGVHGLLDESADERAAGIRFALQMEIDRINIRLLFERKRNAPGKSSLSSATLPGGTLSAGLLRRIAAAPGITEAMEMLGPTPYRELVERLYEYLATGRFALLERLFDSIILHRLWKAAMAQPLSLSVMVYYVWAKFHETVNLRLIARGAAEGLPHGRLHEEMVYA